MHRKIGNSFRAEDVLHHSDLEHETLTEEHTDAESRRFFGEQGKSVEFDEFAAKKVTQKAVYYFLIIQKN